MSAPSSPPPSQHREASSVIRPTVRIPAAALLILLLLLVVVEEASAACTTSVSLSARLTPDGEVRVTALLTPGSGDDECYLYGAGLSRGCHGAAMLLDCI